ncbi:MAG: hypothetical protein SH818_17530 [Saprospiraceae bacterium]|nr:hypothetical protein [Saprospiraceae bacterium]
MKTLFFTSVMMLLTAGLSASEVSFKLTSYGRTLILNTANWTKADIQVEIQDPQGHILTTQEYSKTEAGKLKRFNLSSLANGEYVVTLSDEQCTYNQTLTLGTKSVVIHPEIKTFIKPQILVNQSTLKVNFLNLGKTATLKILDHQNETVYQTLIEQPAFNKQYNLSKLAKGDYTVMVSQEDKYYAQAFVLK